MPPVVKLSAAERIINALIHLPRKRADDFMARQQKEAAVIRPIVDEFVAAARAEGARAERERWKALLEDERRDWHSLASNWPDDARQLEQIDEVFDEIIRAAQDEHGGKGE